jgi:hypothetical protein
MNGTTTSRQASPTLRRRALIRRARSVRHWAANGSLSTRPFEPAAAQAQRASQSGQTLVLFSIFLTVILGMAALVLDQGLLRKSNLDLHNALDSGALAGVGLLRDDPVGAERTAREYVQANFPDDLPDENVNVSFRCLIGTESGAPRLSDIPLACDPGADASWVMDDDSAFSPCDPSEGDVCNTIVLSGPAERDYLFAPVLGIESGWTQTQIAAACKGLCGERPEVPPDLVLVLDRTGSMSGADTTNAVNASHSVRRALRPEVQRLAFGALGPSRTGQVCRTHPDSSIGQARPSDLRRWVPMGLTGIGSGTGDYRGETTEMARAIECVASGNGGGPFNSSTGTDLADPMLMATYELQTSGRSDATHAILLVSDGQPNNSTSGTRNYCQEASQAAAGAKAAGIEVFTVAFGIDGIACDDPVGSSWHGRDATYLLADMATDSVYDGGCPGTENDDGDHFFCVPRTEDLEGLFQKAIVTMSAHSRLIRLPEGA